MKYIKLKSPQIIEIESKHISNIKDALIEAALFAKEHDIEIDFCFNGFLFNIDKNTKLNDKLRNYNDWLNYKQNLLFK